MSIELAKAKQILVSKIGDMLVDGDLQSFLSDVLSALSLKLEDAPSDGKQYSREDGSWSEVVIPTPDVTEAPVDGKQYARQNSNWSEVVLPAAGVPEAPTDGKQYARKDADWVEVTGGGSVDPSSGFTRHDFKLVDYGVDPILGGPFMTVDGVLDPIDFPGDIGKVSYFGAMPSFEGYSLPFQRINFNTPTTNPSGLGLYLDSNEQLDPSSDLENIFKSYGGVPITPGLEPFITAATYTSIPVELYGEESGVIVTQTITWYDDNARATKSRERVLYKPTGGSWMVRSSLNSDFHEPLAIFPDSAPLVSGTALNTTHTDFSRALFSVVRATILPGGTLVIQNNPFGSDLVIHASADNTTDTPKEVTFTIPLRPNSTVYFNADPAYVTIISHKRY